MARLRWANGLSSNGRWMIQSEHARGEGRWTYLMERGGSRGSAAGTPPSPDTFGSLRGTSAALARSFDPPGLREGTAAYAKALAQHIEDNESTDHQTVAADTTGAT